MYPNAQEKLVIEAAERIMVETMARYDPSHDKYHVERVRKTALAIARSLPACPDLLSIEIASLLHDVLDKKYVSEEEAADPYNYFLPYFNSMAELHGVDLIKDGRAKLITQIISNVSWTTEKKLREQDAWSKWHNGCVELHCVQDADRLDAIGAFGVMRCSAYSSITNLPLHTPSDDPVCTTTAVQHFHDKLVHICDRLKTEPGKRAGEKRHKVLLAFLESVDEEYNAVLS